MSTHNSVVPRLIWPVVASIIAIALSYRVVEIHAILGLPDGVLLLMRQSALAMVWLACGWLFNRLMVILFWEGIVGHALGRKPPSLIVQLSGIVVFLLVVSGIIWFVFERSVGILWAASGAVGLVIGLAVQNLILDTFAGLAIHLERSFKVGDLIDVHQPRSGTYTGRVEETNWRTTKLRTKSNNVVVVPNSLLTTTVITNHSQPESAEGFDMTFVLDFSVPTERAERIFRAALMSTIGGRGPLAEPRPTVQINGVGQYGVEYKLGYHLDVTKVSAGKARDTITRAVLKHIQQAGLSLSYPRQDLFLARMPWRHKNWSYMKDQVRQLARISIFSGLEEEDLKFIAEHMSIHELDEKTVVVKQGDEGSSMFILAEGLLEVLFEQPDGSSRKIADMAPGGFFGEKSLLTGQPRSATVICVTQSVVCEITKNCMKSLLDRKPELAEILGRATIERDLENEIALSRATKEEVDSKVSSTVSDLVAKIRQFFSR